jgi:hypothetical protein
MFPKNRSLLEIRRNPSENQKLLKIRSEISRIIFLCFLKKRIIFYYIGPPCRLTPSNFEPLKGHLPRALRDMAEAAQDQGETGAVCVETDGPRIGSLDWQAAPGASLAVCIDAVRKTYAIF